MNTEYLQYRTAAFLSMVLPRRLAYGIGCRAADAFYARDRRGREAVEANLRVILGATGRSVSDSEFNGMVRETFRQFGKYLVDFFRYTRLSPRRANALVEMDGRARLDEALALGKGVLLVTAHLGSWEIGGGTLAAMGYDFNAVVLPENNRRTNAMFQRYRTRRGIKVIPLGRAARATLAALKRGGIVGLLADRDYSPHADVAELFGRKVRLPSGPARLCLMSGSPMVPVFLLRLPDDRFLLRVHPPMVPGSASTVGDLQAGVCRILEDEIARNPCQWFMFDNFWSPRNHFQRNRLIRGGGGGSGGCAGMSNPGESR